ncbi:MAG TPA: NAD(+) synthase [Planctomycetaceae bacterium]|nr:NAD(+) synthase [Planctomycetaceae bacterium]
MMSDHSEQYFDTIVRELRRWDFVRGRDDWPFVIGVSGGIDSAVVLCLLERSVGPNRVRAFNLPSRFNSAATRDAAKTICERLGIVLGEIPIDPIAETVRETLQRAGFEPGPLHFENIQAKIRGTDLLSNIAGILGGLLTNNGNKVEAILGYATLYGDVNGAVRPIGDLTKLEVWALAAHLNDRIYRREVIPRTLIPEHPSVAADIPPSAELAPDQIDPMKWGYHDALAVYFQTRLDAIADGKTLEPVLSAWKNGVFSRFLSAWNGLAEEENDAVLDAHGLSDRQVFLDDLYWFLRSVHAARFKRLQSPPAIPVHESVGMTESAEQTPWTLTRDQLERMADAWGDGGGTRRSSANSDIPRTA